MGCLFSNLKETGDDLYLDINELKEIPEHINKNNIKSHLKNPIPKPYSRNKPAVYYAKQENQEAARIESELSEQKVLFDSNANVDTQGAFDGMFQEEPYKAKIDDIHCNLNKTITSCKDSEITHLILPLKATRNCSFDLETHIMEYNPKKSINIYRLEQGNLHDERDEDYSENDDDDYSTFPTYEVICNDHFRDNSNENVHLAFQNRNFEDVSVESDKGGPRESRNVYPKGRAKVQLAAATHSSYAHTSSVGGVRRVIGQRKGAQENVYGRQNSNEGESAATTRIPNSASSTFRSNKNRQESHERLSSSGVSSESIENENHHNYHGRRRISAISTTSMDKETLNSLDGISHLHPQHASFNMFGSMTDRRSSSSFDSNVRRLSINLVQMFHNQNQQ